MAKDDLIPLSDSDGLIPLSEEKRKLLTPIAGSITSGFGDSRDQGARTHHAIDIGAPAGTEFYAPANIRVTHVREKMSNSPGGMVWGMDDEGQLHKFIHVVPGVKVGDTVQAGQPMGTLYGMKGPHLHWGIKNPATDEPIDPETTYGFKKGTKMALDWRTEGMVAGPATPTGKRDTSAAKQKAIEGLIPLDESDLIPLSDEGKSFENRTVSGGKYPQEERSQKLLQLLAGLGQRPDTVGPFATTQLPGQPADPVSELAKRAIGGDVALGPQSGITAGDLVANLASTGTESLKPLVAPVAKGLDWIQEKAITPVAEKLTGWLPEKIQHPGDAGSAAALGTFNAEPEDFKLTRDVLEEQKHGFPLRGAAQLGAELAGWSAIGGASKYLGGKLAGGASRFAKGMIEGPGGSEILGRLSESEMAAARQSIIDSMKPSEFTQPTAERLSQADLNYMLQQRAVERQGRMDTILGEQGRTLPSEAGGPTPTVPGATQRDVKIAPFEQQTPDILTSEKLTPAKMELIQSGHQAEMDRVMSTLPAQTPAGVSSSIWDLQRKQLKDFYGGGTKLYGGIPLDAFVDEQVLEKGMSPAMAIAMAARKYNKTPKEVMAALANKSPVDLGKAATLAKDTALDSFHKPFVPVKDAIAEIGDQISDITKVGAEKPEIPRTPTKIDPAAPDPLRDLRTRERVGVSPSVWDNGIFPGMKGIVADYYQSLNDYLFKSAYYKKWLDTAFKGFMPDVKASVKEGEKVLGPLWTRYVKLVKPAIQQGAEAAALEEELAGLVKDPTHPRVAELKAQIAKKQEFIDSVYAANKQAIEDIMASRDQGLQYLGSKYSNVKIKAAADGKEWALKSLTPEESKVVESMRGVLDDTKSRMEAAGMPVIKENYTPYVWAHGSYSADPMIDKGFNYLIDKMMPYKTENPIHVSKFLSRTPGASDWFPYAYQTMDPYIKTVERKLAFNPMHSKWGEAFKGWQASGEYPELSKAVKRFYEQMFSYEGGRWNEDVVNKLVNYTYFAQLWGNMRSALLHLGKLRFTPTEHGFQAAIDAVPHYAKAIFGKGTAENKAMNFYMRQNQIVAAIEQNPFWHESLSDGFWQRIRDAGNLTKYTEHIDRGINLFATMIRGQRLQSDIDTIHKAIIHYQNKLNFSAADMPSFMRGPVGRAATMYAGQPWKSWEYQLGVGRRAFGSTPDVFGDTKNFAKFLRMAGIMGSMLGAGAYAGVSLWKHVAHIPFESETRTGEPGLATPPWANVLLAGHEAGIRGMVDETARSVMPFQSIVNDIKYATGTIPKKFDDNVVAALLGIPTIEGLERQAIAQAKAAKQEKWRHKGGISQQAIDYWEGK